VKNVLRKLEPYLARELVATPEQREKAIEDARGRYATLRQLIVERKKELERLQLVLQQNRRDAHDHQQTAREQTHRISATAPRRRREAGEDLVHPELRKHMREMRDDAWRKARICRRDAGLTLKAIRANRLKLAQERAFAGPLRRSWLSLKRHDVDKRHLARELANSFVLFRSCLSSLYPRVHLDWTAYYPRFQCDNTRSLLRIISPDGLLYWLQSNHKYFPSEPDARDTLLVLRDGEYIPMGALTYPRNFNDLSTSLCDTPQIEQETSHDGASVHRH
jgi:hypothetical protein